MINPTLKHVVLAFRGTTSAADWAADVNAIRINPYGAKPRVDGKEVRTRAGAVLCHSSKTPVQ